MSVNLLIWIWAHAVITYMDIGACSYEEINAVKNMEVNYFPFKPCNVCYMFIHPDVQVHKCIY